MATPHDFMLADMKAKYDESASSAAFDRLYEDDLDFGHMFSVLHKRLNEHFDSINGRARTTHHYWADPSREMIALIDEIETDLYDLKRAGIDVAFDPTYQEALERCRPWLSPSGAAPFQTTSSRSGSSSSNGSLIDTLTPSVWLIGRRGRS